MGNTSTASGRPTIDTYLPSDYGGRILVCDIDHTLRRTRIWNALPFVRQHRIHHARRLVRRVAEQGIPVLYLSAAPAWFRSQNQKFLAKFPQGTLIDRTGMGLVDLDPFDQPRIQGLYKARVLRRVRRAYPQAKLVCIGDDRYGDAYAYTGNCHDTYIRRDRRASSNYPYGFTGQRFRKYDEATERSVAEVAGRASAHGARIRVPRIECTPVGRIVRPKRQNDPAAV